MYAPLLFVSIVSALKMQNQESQTSTSTEDIFGVIMPNKNQWVPETNLNTLLSANMEFNYPQAPSQIVKDAYTNIIRTCIVDLDTVFLGIYLGDNERTMHVRHIQTSTAGHADHMKNGQPAVTKMVDASVAEGMSFVGSDLQWPKSFTNDPTLIMLVQYAHSQGKGRIRNYEQIAGKKHQFTGFNDHQADKLSLVMIDQSIKLQSGLSAPVLKLVEKFVQHAEGAPMQASFDVHYRAEDQLLAFREIYQNAEAASQFSENTKDLWGELTSLGTDISREVAGPSSQIETLRSLWKKEETKFFTQFDGFQRVQVHS